MIYQFKESEYFNWHCVICSKLALSPLNLEMQHMTYDFSVYCDVNDESGSNVMIVCHCFTSNVLQVNLSILLQTRDLFVLFLLAKRIK